MYTSSDVSDRFVWPILQITQNIFVCSIENILYLTNKSLPKPIWICRIETYGMMIWSRMNIICKKPSSFEIEEICKWRSSRTYNKSAFIVHQVQTKNSIIRWSMGLNSVVAKGNGFRSTIVVNEISKYWLIKIIYIFTFPNKN